MNKLYDFYKRNKWVLWTVLIVSFGCFIFLGLHCNLEENIFKLLPKTDNEVAEMAFHNIKLKDKVFVQTLSAEGKEADPEVLAEAMDMFLEEAVLRDSATGAILNTLAEVDPLVLLDAAGYAMEHGPAYVDVTEEELDSLCSEEHIRQQIRMYMELLDTDMGANFYDIIAQDPCGISLKNLPSTFVFDPNASDKSSRFQYNHIYSEGAKSCIGFITPAIGTDDSRTASKMLKHLEEAKAVVEAEYPDVEVVFHGTLILAGGNSRRIRQDLAMTIGISLTIIILLLGISFKRPSYIAMMLVPIAYGAMFSMACLYLLKGGMSLMALGLGAVVLGVALSYCLHVLIHYVYTGDVHQTLAEQTKPVVLGSLTTIGAFACLLFTQSALLKDFGAFALLTIVGTTGFSLTLMPQFFPKKSEPNKRVFAMLERINNYEIDRNKWICAIVVVFCVVCIAFSGKYEFDSNLRNIGYISPEVNHAQTEWNTNMNGNLTRQYYASIANSLDEALEQLPAIEACIDSLKEEGIAIGGIKTSAIMPSLSRQEERNETWEAYFTEDRQKEVWSNVVAACRKEGVDPSMFDTFREAMGIVAEPEMVAEIGLIPDEIMGNFVEEVGDKVFVYIPVNTTIENKRVAMDALTKVPGCIVLDPYYYSTDLVELIRSDFNRIMWVSAIFVLLLLIITYRNFWIALIAFCPMMISWYTVLGAMAIMHQPFNLINIVVSSFIFGIGVDYSIFILDGLMRPKGDKTMVYHKTAITISATVLIVSMFSLIFAKHPAINSIALASLVGMITTLMLSYTIQPNLYRLYRYLHNRRVEYRKARKAAKAQK